ncbi:lipopolysaccharide biosynthesis protein [Acidobacteriota bacterium]
MKEKNVMQVSKTIIPRTFAKLKKSAFFKNILVVMTGTIIGQVISFSLSPIISRLFTPDDFGIFGSFSAILGLFSAGVTLGYSQAIMLPKDKLNAMNLFVLSCLCTFMVSFICLMFCLIAPNILKSEIKSDGVIILVLLVLATLVSGINQSCQAWSVRVKAFKHTSASQVIRSTTSSGTKVGLGLLKVGALGLIVSNVLANILASLNLVRVLLPDLLSLRRSIQWDLIKRLAKDYRDFPMYSASQAVINALSMGFPILILTHFFGTNISGAYTFAITIISLPMGFILTALRQVLYQKASEIQHQNRSLASLYVKITAGLFAVTLLPTLILVIWAPQIFAWIFGSQWSMAGEFARSLIIWFAIGFCNLPAHLYAKIIRIQRFIFFYDIALLGVRSVVLLIGGLYLTALQTVLLFSLVGAGMNIFLIFRVGNKVMRNEGSVTWSSVREALVKKQI